MTQAFVITCPFNQSPFLPNNHDQGTVLRFNDKRIDRTPDELIRRTEEYQRESQLLHDQNITSSLKLPGVT